MRYYDENFLKELNKARLRTHYAKITLLSWEENVISEIQGKVTAGNISVNSSSAIRRTVSLTMAVDETVAQITNLESAIAINKKIKIDIGLKNPFKKYIEDYGEIVWFPQGMYVLSSVNSTRNTNNWTLSITAKDKTCLLDGTAGGTYPAAAVLHERWIYNQDGSVTIEHPVLRQIIYEAVNHYGGERSDNIFINDLADTVKMRVKYDGFKPIYYYYDDQKGGQYVFGTPPSGVTYNTVGIGDDAGYEMTDFTYPGELVINAGDTVVTVLDKIVDVLGNYEYFYDVDGHFIFQEIKNYTNKQSPLDELASADNDNCLPNLVASDYVRIYDTHRSIFQLTDLDAAAAITHTPKYDNIKNDFYVWGERSENILIRYHLAIDAKPLPDYAMKYMWPVYDDEGKVVDYRFTTNNVRPSVSGYIVGDADPPCTTYEWREELYRQGLYMRTKTGTESGNNYYYEELLSEWRKLYNPATGWVEDVYKNPQNIDFWLDFIDTSADLGKYSVGQIGRRTEVVNNKDIKTVYNKDMPDVVFIPALVTEGKTQEEIAKEQQERQALITYYNTIGQPYCQLSNQMWSLFSISSTGTSCFDEIRNLLYQHLNYHATIAVTCIPVYYLEPNNIIYVEDAKSGIIGYYQITQFSLPLTYNGTMNITATEVLTRI